MKGRTGITRFARFPKDWEGDGVADVQIESGYTRIANDLLKALARSPLNGTQFRIIMLVIRETYGFQRKETSISESYIATGLGLQRQNVHRELKFLFDHNILSVVQTATFTSPRVISINKNYDTWLIQLQELEVNTGIKNDSSPVIKSDSSTGIKSDSQVKKPLKKPIKKDMPEALAPDSLSEIELILNDKTLYPIYQKQIDEWCNLYPAVDVMQELRKMKGWLDANPTKRKTNRGVLRFVNSWLAREQDKGPKQNNQTERRLPILT